jgi:hypothetical protein
VHFSWTAEVAASIEVAAASVAASVKISHFLFSLYFAYFYYLLEIFILGKLGIGNHLLYIK